MPSHDFRQHNVNMRVAQITPGLLYFRRGCARTDFQNLKWVEPFPSFDLHGKVCWTEACLLISFASPICRWIKYMVNLGMHARWCEAVRAGGP